MFFVDEIFFLVLDKGIFDVVLKGFIGEDVFVEVLCECLCVLKFCGKLI